MLCAKRLFLVLQRLLVHLLGLYKLALISIKEPKVINRVKRQRVLCTKRLLLALQRLLIHLLGLYKLVLIGVKVLKIVNCVKR